MMPTTAVLANIAIRTTVIYVLILIGVRITGKREVGQMTPFDLTLLLLLSNSVQNAMTGPDTSLPGGIIAALTLFVLNYVIAELSGMNRKFRTWVAGHPTLLIHNGKMVPQNMSREHITPDTIQRALREHGIACVADVALGVLEVDGSISCLKYDDVPQTIAPQRRLKFLQKHQ